MLYRYTIKDEDVERMLKTASDYNALRALMGWSYGANDAQIGIVMPQIVAKYARSIRVKMPDGTFEGIGLGLLGNMQAVEAMHADLKIAMRALTNGHGDCWEQLMNWDSISKVIWFYVFLLFHSV